MALELCEKQLEESSMVTECIDFEEVASGSSGITCFSKIYVCNFMPGFNAIREFKMLLCN